MHSFTYTVRSNAGVIAGNRELVNQSIFLNLQIILSLLKNLSLLHCQRKQKVTIIEMLN